MRPLSLVPLVVLLAAHGALAMPAPQVTLTATIPGAIDPTLIFTVTTQPITTTPTTTTTTTTATTTTATTTTTTTTSTSQDGGGSAVTTSSPTSQATAIPTPWIIVLPGYGNVTRQGDSQTGGGQQQSITETSTSTATTTSTTETQLDGTATETTQTLTISFSDIPVVTATIILPQPTPTQAPARVRKLHRRQGSSPTATTTTTTTTATTATTTTQQGGGQASATTGPGDEIFAYGQAYLFEPPAQEQATDPYFGSFAAFRAENLTLEQEQRLVNRSYYFKGTPYSGQAQVQLAANQSSPASDPSVFDIPSPSQQPPLVPKQLSWQSPNNPQASRKSLAVSPQTGVLAINTSWTRLHGGFISVQPVQGLLGSVLMPYQVAQLEQGQEPVSNPTNAGVSYLVLEPQNTRERQAQLQQGGQGGQQQPQQPGQGGGIQGGFAPSQIEVLRTQAVIDKHIAVISDIDDVIKVTRVANPRQALLNTFTQDYVPTAGMPSLFQNTLAQTYANTSTAVTFHYASGAPIPLAPSLLQFLDAYYPPGSLTLRPVTSFTPQSFVNALADGFDNNFRRQAHVDILHTYASAQAVIFGDTASRTFPTYVRVLEQFPGRIACVYLRNLTAAVEPGASIPLTREQVFEQVRRVLPAEMRGRVEQMVVPFVDPGELVGMNLTTTPAKCL